MDNSNSPNLTPPAEPLVRLELHCHTRYSKDSLTEIADLLAACSRKGIDRVAITDHNEIAGALQAKQLDPQRVIVGEEIMTECGELLAFFVTEKVPRGLPPLEAIQRLREQGAFISVSHPFDTTRNGSWRLPDLMEIAPLVDAVETFNARCMVADFNHRAQAFATQVNLPGTAGSDAHITWELGRALQVLPAFDDAETLRAALVHARQDARLSPFFIHFSSRMARWAKALRKK